MSRVEWEGRYLAVITEYGLFQSRTSQAVALDLRFETLAYFDKEGLADMPGYATRGRFFIIGRQGDVLEDNARNLADATGWDGDLDAINAATWRPPKVQIVVESETNNGRTYYNAVRIFPEDWQATGNVAGGDAEQIARRYTGALKSLVARHRGQAPAPSPPPAEAAPEPAPVPAPAPPRRKLTAAFEWNETEAWKKFRPKVPEDIDGENVRKLWEAVIRFKGGGKPREELTPDEWQAVAEFDLAALLEDDDIPF